MAPPVWSQRRKFPFATPSENIIAVGTINTDITDRKQTEAQLRQAQKMEAAGQLTGGEAHDFNNFLASIFGHAEIIEEKLGGDDQSVKTIIRAAERGAQLTQRLLSLSRRQALFSRPVDLRDLVGGVNQLLHRTLGETIDIDTVMAPALWDTVADPGQLENALLNRALNARDATIASQAGHGATVILYLPRAEETVERSVTDDLPLPPPPMADGETGLVVEDDPDVCALTEAMLRNLGYRVLSVDHARAGLDILQREPGIDLMLSDVMLPGGMSGPDLAEQAKALRPDIRTLFMSGHAQQSDHLRSVLPEGCDLLDKPFRRFELAKRVRAALDR